MRTNEWPIHGTMLKTCLSILLASAAFAAKGFDGTATVNGIEWKYSNAKSYKACLAGVTDKSISGAIEIPDALNEYTITNIAASAFQDCTNLTSVTIPASVRSISTSAFSGCTSLKAVMFADNSSLTYIGTYAFYNCSALEEMQLPTGIKKITGYTFSGCTNLKRVLLPDGLLQIDGNAFSHCTSLKTLAIPVTVTNVKDTAFSECSELTTVYAPNGLSLSAPGVTVFYDTPPGALFDLGTAPILTGFVPSPGGDVAWTIDFRAWLVCGNPADIAKGKVAVLQAERIAELQDPQNAVEPLGLEVVETQGASAVFRASFRINEGFADARTLYMRVRIDN